MNLLRNALIGGILLVVFLLFIRWNEFRELQIAAQTPTATQAPSALVTASEQDIPTNNALPSTAVIDDDVPSAPQTVESSAGEAVATTAPSTQLIEVATDSLEVLIDPHGGDIVQVALPKHLANINDKDSRFLLLANSDSHTYIAQSDLVGKNGTHVRDAQGKPQRAVFSTQQSTYTLKEGDASLVVDLQHTQSNGTNITKRFHFERDSYLIRVEYLIDNQSEQTWKAAMYGRIKRDDYKPAAGGMFQLQPFLGAATRTNDDKFKKLTFSDIRDQSLKFEYEGGWVALVQHYFVSAWVPDESTTNNFRIFQSKDREHYLLQFTTPQYAVAPGQQTSIKASFYAGPKVIENLEPVAPGLDLTVDFGFLWFVAKPLFLVMDFIHDIVGNWGFAIILLTFLVKLVFFYPSAISYRSMAKMRKLMPLMQELKERYGDDRQRMGMETMKLYKKEGVNPLGGCLPMIMQMPVFMALYWMIMESVELRHSPFLFWINDLSVKDPYFILPVIMGGIMYVQQKLNPPPQDPMQAKIFQMMPIGFTFILAFLPAALTLYMAVNTALSFLQQYVITKQIENADS